MRWWAMRNSDLDLIALLTKGLCDLRSRFDKLARDPGPAGRDGIDGRDGVDGVDGKVGRDGIDGRDGKDGIAGARGEVGPRGQRGQKGDRGPMPDHEWDGAKLRFQKPDGNWGSFVNLRGPRGIAGVSGGGGGSIRDFFVSEDAGNALAVGSDGGLYVAQNGAGIQRPLFVDASRPLAYLGYVDHIARLDYATWPPTVTTTATTDIHADWPNRATLGYA